MLLAYARATILARLEGGAAPELSAASKRECGEKAGVFVSLHLDGRLRGCIGTMMPLYELHEAVRRNALNAAFSDPRFGPLTREEAVAMTIEISVLSPSRRIGGVDEFRVGEHGVILEVAGRRSVFLPQVAPGQGWECS